MESRAEAVPFISFDNKFIVDQRAIDHLSQFTGQIGVVAICGRYRTGKSYLLNRIFSNAGDSSSDLGFEVGPTINPCTKGLWMMKQPIYVPESSKSKITSPDFEWKLEPEEGYFPVFVVDTEGLSAVDQDENHDTRIFLLAVLLSSLMIFNSTGTIDENALNNLSLVVNLSKTI